MIKYDFKNKTVLITAGSKGIGFELANHFCKYNANVAICSRNYKNLQIAKKRILSKNCEAKILTIRFDIGKFNNVN